LLSIRKVPWVSFYSRKTTILTGRGGGGGSLFISVRAGKYSIPLTRILPLLSIFFNSVFKAILTFRTITCIVEKALLNRLIIYQSGNRNRSVGISTGCELKARGSIPGGGNTLFYIPQQPNRLWGPPTLQSDGHREHFP
jgi:hypothetical protein